MQQEAGSLSEATGSDLHQKVLQCLFGEKDKTALDLSRELDIAKNSIQRSLYELQKLDKVKKINGKHWRACGDRESEATPIGPSLVPYNNKDVHLVRCNPPVLDPMEVAVLKELKNLGSCSALKLAKNMGHQSKKGVNPTLYTLEMKGLVRKEGGLWLCVSDRDERDTGASGIGSSSPGTGGTGTRRQMPNIQVNNHYNFNISVDNSLSEKNTTINQQGPCTNNISSSVQGNSYLQVGSRNTMDIGDSSQEEENQSTQGSSEPRVPEDQVGGTSELNNTEEPREGASVQGGTESQDGGALEPDSEFNIKVITEQLSGFQIGNRNQMRNGWESPIEGPPREGPPSEGPPSEGPPSEGPPSEGPPREGPPSEGPPSEGPPREGPPSEGPPREGPPREGPPREVPPSEGPPSEGHSFESFSSEDSFVWESR
ncbi:uncharacterized protein LOC144488029 [Mustelus asterias]